MSGAGGESGHGAGQPAPTDHPVGMRALARTFFWIGLTSYGGPAIVAQIRKVTVQKKLWLTDDEFSESLAFCQTLPGPIAVQTGAHVAWRLRGALGALVATVAYVLPAFLLMLGLSALYFRTGQLPAVQTVLQGLRAVVVAIVADSILSMAQPSLKDWRGVLLAGVAAAALLGGVSAILVLLGAALLAVPLLWNVLPPAAPESRVMKPRGNRWRGPLVIGLVALLFAGATFLSGALNPVLPDLTLTLMKVDMLAFGGGYTAVALMHDQVVKMHPWLNPSEFLDGLALGQITPGPVILTATFIGYKVAGLAGAVAATVGVFLPSWLLLALLAPQFERIRGIVAVYRMVRGLLAAFVAMLIYVLWQVGGAALQDGKSLLLAIAALAALRFKIPPLWVVGGGMAISAILFR